MSDNQRRTLCQFLFFMICILPTAVTGYWICHPQTASSWEIAIQAKLGLTTTIDSIETPGPYVTLLRGVQFSDPEIGPLFEKVHARIEFGDVNFVKIPYKVKGLTNRGLACLIKNINQHLVRNNGAGKHWRIEFLEDTMVEEATVAQQLKAQGIQRDPATGNLVVAPNVVLSELKIHVGPAAPTTKGTIAVAQFQVGKQSEIHSTDAQPNAVNTPLDRTVHFEISRTEQAGNMIDLLELDTKEVALPCWLLNLDNTGWLNFPSLGPQAQFVGHLTLVPTGRTYLELQGSFTELERVHAINVMNCRFQNGDNREWLVNLIETPQSLPKQIQYSDLIGFREEISFQIAIDKMLDNRPRVARESQNYR